MSGLVIHNPADIIAQLIIELGLGTDPEQEGGVPLPWPVYSQTEPDTPDATITVYDTQGRLHAWDQVTGEGVEHYGIQVRVRSITPTDCKARIELIKEALDKTVHYTHVSLDGIVYIVYSIDRTSPILNLGKDVPSSLRNLMTINATASLRGL